MGEEIERRRFSQADEVEFRRRATEETALVRSWLQEDRMEDADLGVGFELEGWLVDQDCMPAPENLRFLERAADPSLVPELGRFNFEINSAVHTRGPRLLSGLHAELEGWMHRCRDLAANLGGLRPLWIGIPPTLRPDMLGLEQMTPQNRYFALAERAVALRQGRPAHIAIDRFEHVELDHPDVMLEAAATSVQLHTQVRPADAVAAYNAAQLIAGPLTAICANSPFLFGRKLWDETRIAVFEQAVQLSGPEIALDPVTFGHAPARRSIVELLEDNLRFPVLLPHCYDAPPEALRHLKLLNGQVWRWNRLIVGVGERPHLRIEHRPLPAGPTAVDTVANFALYLGLLRALTPVLALGRDPEADFRIARENFYACARLGLKAEVTWLDGGRHDVQALLLEVLLPSARRALREELLLEEDELGHYLDQVMRPRLRTGFTGAAWQKCYIDTHGRDFQAMTQAYLERAAGGAPVSAWKV